MKPPLEIAEAQLAGWTVLTPRGEIDLATVEVLEAAVGELVDNGTSRLVIDMTEVTFLDSTGLRALLAAQAQLGELGGALRLVVNGGPVERLFDIAGVSETLDLAPSLEAATG